MTNAEKIRSMNTYEMAVFLAIIKADTALLENYSYSYSTEEMMKNLEWLSKEAEQGRLIRPTHKMIGGKQL